MKCVKVITSGIEFQRQFSSCTHTTGPKHEGMGVGKFSSKNYDNVNRRPYTALEARGVQKYAGII